MPATRPPTRSVSSSITPEVDTFKATAPQSMAKAESVRHTRPTKLEESVENLSPRDKRIRKAVYAVLSASLCIGYIAAITVGVPFGITLGVLYGAYLLAASLIELASAMQKSRQERAYDAQLKAQS